MASFHHFIKVIFLSFCWKIANRRKYVDCPVRSLDSSRRPELQTGGVGFGIRRRPVDLHGLRHLGRIARFLLGYGLIAVACGSIPENLTPRH
jgi:hypothetical protein